MKLYKKSNCISSSQEIYADNTEMHDYLEELKVTCPKISNNIVDVDYFDDDLNSYVVIYDRPAHNSSVWQRTRKLISGLDRYGIHAKYISSMENFKLIEIAIIDE